MTEFFKEIPDWPMYEVSNWGNVRRIISPGRSQARRSIKPCGRNYTVILSDTPRRLTASVARLMLVTFIGPPPFLDAQARHLDDIQRHNVLGNLEWGTRLDNAADAKRNGRYAARQRPVSGVTSTITVHPDPGRGRA